MSDTALLILVPFLFIPVFLAIWCGVVFLVATVGGWRQLAKVYATSGYTGQPWEWQSGRFRFGARYNAVLTVGADPRGLYLATNALFRPGHPPLLIPWEDVELRDERTFVFRRVPGVPLTLSRTLAGQIATARRSVAR
jgi:hypothetical protein